MRFQDINFQYVRHGNDYVWGFDIPGTNGRFHGWTRDKLSNFHVLDEQNTSYTSFETKPAFEAWLAAESFRGNQVQNNNSGNLIPQIVYTGLPKTNVNGFNATPIIILGALGVIYFLYTR